MQQEFTRRCILTHIWVNFYKEAMFGLGIRFDLRQGLVNQIRLRPIQRWPFGHIGHPHWQIRDRLTPEQLERSLDTPILGERYPIGHPLCLPLHCAPFPALQHMGSGQPSQNGAPFFGIFNCTECR